jgi:hypothetical protein
MSVLEQNSQILWSQELLLLLGLIFSTALYFLPLNAWLCGFRWKISLKLFQWNFLAAFLSWCLYRLFKSQVEGSGYTGLLMTGIVFFNVVLSWSWVRFFQVHEETLLEDRVGGWILFGPILMIAVIISTPLFSALMTSLF